MRRASAVLTVFVLMSVLAGVTLAGPPVPDTEGPAPARSPQGPVSEGSGVQFDGSLYMTSIDCATGAFARYDPASDSWTTLNDYYTNAQMAVSAAGDLYALNCQTQSVELYDPATDSWSFVVAGPPGIDYNQKGNLEIHSIGEFLYSGGTAPTLYWTTGGSWYSMPLPFQAYAMGDYDPTSNQYVVGEAWTTNAHLIDAFGGWSITSFTSPVYNGECARFSSILDGRYYFEAGGSNFHSFDLSSPSDPPLDHGVTWGWFDSSAADRGNGIIYVASLSGEELIYYDPATNSFTPLAPYMNIGNHSSLAFVPSVEVEPKMFVRQILSRYLDYGGRYKLQAKVRIWDEFDVPVAGALVDVVWTYPDGSTTYQSKVTNVAGVAKFQGQSLQLGDHEICVLNVTAGGYMYDPGMNWEECETVTIP